MLAVITNAMGTPSAVLVYSFVFQKSTLVQRQFSVRINGCGWVNFVLMSSISVDGPVSKSASGNLDLCLGKFGHDRSLPLLATHGFGLQLFGRCDTIDIILIKFDFFGAASTIFCCPVDVLLKDGTLVDEYLLNAVNRLVA